MEYYCLECNSRIADSPTGLCRDCGAQRAKDGFTTLALNKIYGLNKEKLKRNRRSHELHPEILENGSWHFSYDDIEAFLEKHPEIVNKFARIVPSQQADETDNIQVKGFDDLYSFDDFGEINNCKNCNQYPAIKSGFCLLCIDLLISKSEAMRLFGLSLSQFNTLESQGYIKSYTYKSQKRYIRTAISPAVYQALGTNNKWSPSTTSCRSCNKIDNPHYASGYCLECYKKTLEYYTLKQFIQGYNFAEIGKVKGVSRERIRQLFEKAISNEAENVFGDKYSKEDLDAIREVSKEEYQLNNARRLYADKLLENKDVAMQVATKHKITSQKSLVTRLGLTAKAALILEEVLPDVAAKLRSNGDKWSMKYEKCVQCGTTETPHQARGLCDVCYTRSDHHREAQYKWRMNNYEHFRAKQIAYEKEYNKRPEVKERVRKQSHKKRFGSIEVREEALRRDDYACVDCGLSQKEHANKHQMDLNVFHIDGQLENNDLSNLVTLCRNCMSKRARNNALSIKGGSDE